MRHFDGRRLFTAPCGIRTKWPPGWCIPLYYYRSLTRGEIKLEILWPDQFFKIGPLWTRVNTCRISRAQPVINKITNFLTVQEALKWISFDFHYMVWSIHNDLSRFLRSFLPSRSFSRAIFQGYVSITVGEYTCHMILCQSYS